MVQVTLPVVEPTLSAANMFSAWHRSVESSYQNPDDPITIATIITGDFSVTRKLQQGPVVQRSTTSIQKNTLNAFQYALDASGKTAIPGIGAVTETCPGESSLVFRSCNDTEIYFALRK